MWKYFQSSKKRKRSSDCSIRALMVAEKMTWEQSFDYLCKFARKVQDMPNETRVLSKAIESFGYKPQKIEMVNHRKPTVAEFGKEHPKGKYLIFTSGHVVCMINGNWYDTWDCGDCKVLKYFSK